MPAPLGVEMLSYHSGPWLTAKALHFAERFSRPFHTHDDPCVQVIMNGEFHEQGWPERDRFALGEALFRPAGFSHANESMDRSSISLSLQIFQRSAPPVIAASLDQTPPTRVLDPHIRLLASKVQRELTAPDTFSTTVIEALCAEIVVRIVRCAAVGEVPSHLVRLAEHAAQIIQRDFAGPISVESVARAVGADRFELNRAFMRAKGHSPSEHIRLCRVELAKQLLCQTGRSIALIAAECGFADQSHLSKAFTTTLGIPPARFRRQQRG